VTAAYKILAPYVTLRVRDDVSGSDVLLGYYAGAPVPANANRDDVERLARKGMIVLDVNEDEVADLASKGQRQARRGRRPKSAQTT
jgi:hypothetical protein